MKNPLIIFDAQKKTESTPQSMSVRSTHVCVWFYNMHLLDCYKISFCCQWQLTSLLEPHVKAGTEEGTGCRGLLGSGDFTQKNLLLLILSLSDFCFLLKCSCYLFLPDIHVHCCQDTIHRAPWLLDAVFGGKRFDVLFRWDLNHDIYKNRYLGLWVM